MVQSESNLLSQTEYLAALLGSIDDSVVATNENFEIQYWNKKAEELFGCSQEEVIGQRNTNILRFVYTSPTREEAKKILLEKGVWKGRLHNRAKDGTLRLFDVSVTVVRNPQHETIGYVAVHRDITNQDKAETSLSTFLSMLSLTEDYFFVVDKDLNLAFVDDVLNKRNLEMYGVTFSHGENVLKKLPVERREQIRSAFLKALNGEKVQYEVPVKTAKGKQVWLQATYFPVRDQHGVITHACALVKNITPQKQMEEVNEMLYRSRLLFETFMENSPIMSWITDRNGVFKYLNPAFLKNYRINKEVIGQPLSTVFSPSVSSVLLENDTI
ncbi:MAG TPA: PAS domain S-box protein, partial [Flavisolibacter sp.]|nr:PAS domain S-box protein [Flavisolibacter sp.]